MRRRLMGKPVKTDQILTGLTPEKIAGDTGLRWSWITEKLQILNKAGQMVPLTPNRGQQHLLVGIRMQESRGLPVRIMLLKARQFGGSTAVQADIFARLTLLEHRNAFTSAHEASATGRLFDMTKRFHTYMPECGKLPIEKKNGYCFQYSEPHGGGITVATAGTEDAARSGTYQYAHCSECAMWPNQAAAMAAIADAVPYAAGTMIVRESTAKGVGDMFHEDWKAAVKRWRHPKRDYTGYIPIFVGWMSIEDYTMPVPPGYDWSAVVPEVAEDEPELRRRGATPEQLYWRRLKIAEKGGDIDLFRQEYPATSDEAFVTSGRPVVSMSLINHHRSTCKAGRLGRIELDPKHQNGAKIIYSTPERPIVEPCWRFWQVPQEDSDYAGGGDVAEGSLSDPNIATSEPDWSYALFIDRTTLEDVAEYRGQIDPDLFGLEMVKAGLLYNHAWIAPEVNVCGAATLLVMKRARYGRIMTRPGAVDKETGKQSIMYGWRTLKNNRPLMLDQLIMYLRGDPVMKYEGAAIVRSSIFCDELQTWIRTKSGRRDHAPGKHDDTIRGRASCGRS
jgi:hypothetical protein